MAPVSVTAGMDRVVEAGLRGQTGYPGVTLQDSAVAG